MATKWTSLQSCPVTPTSNYVVSKDKSILTAPPTSNGQAKGIHRYSSSSKKWKPFIDYPESLRSNNHTLAYDKDNNCVYLYGEESLIHQFSVPSKFSSKSSYKAYDGQTFGVNVKSSASILVIDQNIHIIGGETNTKHFMWKNAKSPVWQEMHQFDTLKTGNRNNGCVYLKTKRMLYCNLLLRFQYLQTELFFISLVQV